MPTVRWDGPNDEQAGHSVTDESPTQPTHEHSNDPDPPATSR
jgi:hypothetical protein